MTLIIAGYDYERSFEYSFVENESGSNDAQKMEVKGIFVVADSAITSHSGGRTLLNGFKKIYCIKANLWKPYFMPDGSFKDYKEVYASSEIFLGFAGSTLTAQHIINSITEHLGNLRISYTRSDSGSIVYTAIRHCQENPLVSEGISYWDDDTFLDRDFEGLLTGEIIAQTTEYSINEALLSAGRYKLSIEEFYAMHTELVLGVWCPNCKRVELYAYRMQHKKDKDGVLIAYTVATIVPERKVLVLGMRKQFEEAAQNEFETALQTSVSPSKAMHIFLNKAIDQVQSGGSKEIDKPVSFRKLTRNGIERIN